MPPKRTNKQSSRKQVEEVVVRDDAWVIVRGRLVPPRGRPRKVKSLFTVIAEKLPYELLKEVRSGMRDEDLSEDGVYIAHDSMGIARYVGHGNVFNRVTARFREHDQELKYFSFYIVENKNHEREVETLLIRAGGPHLFFNERKKRTDIEPGSVKDYEAGTIFFERQYKRGRRGNPRV